MCTTFFCDILGPSCILIPIHQILLQTFNDTGCIVWTAHGRRVRKSRAKPVVEAQWHHRWHSVTCGDAVYDVVRESWWRVVVLFVWTALSYESSCLHMFVALYQYIKPQLGTPKALSWVSCSLSGLQSQLLLLFFLKVIRTLQFFISIRSKRHLIQVCSESSPASVTPKYIYLHDHLNEAHLLRAFRSQYGH